MTIISYEQFARQLNVSLRSVRGWVKSGMPASRGKIDCKKSLAWVVANIQPQVAGNGELKGAAKANELLGRGGIPSPFGAMSPLEARAMRDRALAERAQFELALLRGDYVEIETVVADMERNYATVRNTALGLPVKLAPKVILCRTATEAEAIIREAIRDALQALVVPKAADTALIYTRRH